MNKNFERLFLFEKHKIKTKMPKKEILKKIDDFADPEYTDYYGCVSEDGFFVAKKSLKLYSFGRSRNSFVPVIRAKITENDGISTVSMVIRMHLITSVFLAPIYAASLLTVVLFPLMQLLFHFAFFKPTKRLKEEIEHLLIY